MIIASMYPCPYDIQDRHDMNASIIKDNSIYAYEEDKLTQIKSEGTVKFPERSLMMGCKELGIVPKDINYWVFPTPASEPDKEAMFLFFSWVVKAYLGDKSKFAEWYNEHVFFLDHHLMHASLAIFASGFEDCSFLCQDGGGDLGDQRDCIFGNYKNNQIEIIREHYGYKTISSFHAFVTDSLGFNGTENGKTSGIAAYGSVKDKLKESFSNKIEIKKDGIVFDRERYNRTNVNISKIKPQEYDRHKIFSQYPSDTNILRDSLGYLPQDIAASGEEVLNETVLKFLSLIYEKFSYRKLVLSGGLFQNVALNYRILNSNMFDEIFIPMAPGDAGLSLGGALYLKNKFYEKDNVGVVSKKTSHIPAFLGPSFSEDETEILLKRFRLKYDKVKDIALSAAKLISQGNVVGWFQGRAEYGPRSLGARSILADPRDVNSKLKVNQLLKKRDWFMPYAPSVKEESFKNWVNKPNSSPYMQIAFQIKDEKQELIPSAIHMDGSSRVHVVSKKDNELYWQLIDYFEKNTGVPVILNTSFNRHGIATISSPRQAIEHLLEGCMDYLAIGPFLVNFEENRFAKDVDFTLKTEKACLSEDCVERLKIVVSIGTDEQIVNYTSDLSELLGVNIEWSENNFIFSGKKVSVETIHEFLKDYITQ